MKERNGRVSTITLRECNSPSFRPLAASVSKAGRARLLRIDD